MSQVGQAVDRSPQGGDNRSDQRLSTAKRSPALLSLHLPPPQLLTCRLPRSSAATSPAPCRPRSQAPLPLRPFTAQAVPRVHFPGTPFLMPVSPSKAAQRPSGGTVWDGPCHGTPTTALLDWQCLRLISSC